MTRVYVRANSRAYEYKPYRSNRHGIHEVGMTLHITPEMHDDLIAYCQKRKISRAAAIRTFIEWGIENDT